MFHRLSLSLCALMFGAGTLSAAPVWKKQLGPKNPGSHPALPPGKVTYDLSWKGIVNSARLEFDIGKPGAHKPGMTVIKSTGKSMGAGGAIFPYTGHGWSEIHSRTLRPSMLTVSEKKNA